jgi:16S rRNA (cytosine967-C5)-methyltransferase
MSRVADGTAVVQDPSSQLVARLAVAVTGGVGRAVDLCAAPGGKTALLETLGAWRLLAAADVILAKAARLARRFERPPVVVADAERPPFIRRGWDLALLDAPCSGTGTFRRHPELKWRLQPEDIDAAAARQRSLVQAALELLAPGGVLVYATCSVEPEENEAHVAELPDSIECVDLAEHLPDGLPWIPTEAGGVRILPHEWGDGFTVHALRRR